MFTDAQRRRGGPRRSLRKESQRKESQVLHMCSRAPAFSEKLVIHWPCPTHLYPSPPPNPILPIII